MPLKERLQRVQARHPGRSLADELDEIALHCAGLPDLDQRTADEIIGYDEHGLPSWGTDLGPYPTVRGIHDACLEIEAFVRAMPANQPDAE